METANYECVRCLFCRTGKEESVVALVEERGWGPRPVRQADETAAQWEGVVLQTRSPCCRAMCLCIRAARPFRTKPS